MDVHLLPLSDGATELVSNNSDQNRLLLDSTAFRFHFRRFCWILCFSFELKGSG
jgi:hypothetical protein